MALHVCNRTYIIDRQTISVVLTMKSLCSRYRSSKFFPLHYGSYKCRLRATSTRVKNAQFNMRHILNALKIKHITEKIAGNEIGSVMNKS